MLHYAGSRRGLGADLVCAVDAALARVQQAPHTFPAWLDAPRYRCIIVEKFRFSIFFRERDSDVVVVAIAHPRRRPGYWLTRDR